MATTAFDLARVVHTGIVVRNLESAMHMYWKTMGIGPWKGYTVAAPPCVSCYRGKQSFYKARVAFASAGPVGIQLIQPLEGESTYRDFLSTRGEGLHHMAVLVRNLDEAVAPFLDHGMSILQSLDGTGASGDGRLVYLDSARELGAILELHQPPSEGVVHWTYPE